MGAHVADLLARQQNHLPPQLGGELDVDLLADDAPAQGVEPGRQERHAQAPARSGKGGVPAFKRADIQGQAQHPQAGLVQRRHGGRPQFRFAMHLHPGLARLDADLHHRRTVLGRHGFPDAVAFAFLADRFGIAAVIAQDFPGPIAGRKLQQEDLRAIQGAVGARRHPHLGEELAMEHRFRFKPAPKPISATLSLRRAVPAPPV